VLLLVVSEKAEAKCCLIYTVSPCVNFIEKQVEKTSLYEKSNDLNDFFLSECFWLLQLKTVKLVMVSKNKNFMNFYSKMRHKRRST
jgi:hypothetical protein